MLDLTFLTDDKTEYKVNYAYKYVDDPDDKGIEMKINRINPIPSGAHSKEIEDDWNRGDLFNRAADLAYSDMESKCVK